MLQRVHSPAGNGGFCCIRAHITKTANKPDLELLVSSGRVVADSKLQLDDVDRRLVDTPHGVEAAQNMVADSQKKRSEGKLSAH